MLMPDKFMDFEAQIMFLNFVIHLLSNFLKKGAGEIFALYYNSHGEVNFLILALVNISYVISCHFRLRHI